MSDKKKLIRSVVIGSLCGLLSCVAMMCVLAAVMLSTTAAGYFLLDDHQIPSATSSVSTTPSNTFVAEPSIITVPSLR